MCDKENIAKRDKVTKELVRHFKAIEKCLVQDGTLSRNKNSTKST
jgi:hypothetical protein